MNQSDVFHVDISPCHMSHVIHFEFSLSEEKICIAKNLCYFVFAILICFSATVFENERKKVLRGSIWKL